MLKSLENFDSEIVSNLFNYQRKLEQIIYSFKQKNFMKYIKEFKSMFKNLKLEYDNFINNNNKSIEDYIRIKQEIISTGDRLQFYFHEISEEYDSSNYGNNTLANALGNLLAIILDRDFDERFELLIIYKQGNIDEYISKNLIRFIHIIDCNRERIYWIKTDHNLTIDLATFDILIIHLNEYLDKIKTTTDKNQLAELYGDLYIRISDLRFYHINGMINDRIMSIIEDAAALR